MTERKLTSTNVKSGRKYRNITVPNSVSPNSTTPLPYARTWVVKL